MMLDYIILLIGLLALSAFFSASEIAIFSISLPRLKALVEKNVKGAKTLEYLKENPKKTLVTILIGNNIANIAIAAISTMLAIKFFGNVGTGVSTGVVTLLVLVFGEIWPKSYAAHNAEKIALPSAYLLKGIMRIIYPLVLLFEFIARKLAHVEKGMKPLVTEDELKAAINIGVESGSIMKEEKEFIDNVLRFGDITVKEVMTHRSEMVCLDAKLRLKDAAKLMNQSKFSRYPIYERSKENIIGCVHIKDLFFALNQKKENKLLKTIAKPINFVPQHKTLNDMFKEFQDKQMHMAIVVNDHGEIIGLVTLEDLLEELVGEIIDESDVKQHLIKRIDKKTIMVHGLTALKDINRFFHTTLPGRQNDTISAIILKNIKRIPKCGEVININNNELTIVEATPKKILKVKIVKLYE